MIKIILQKKSSDREKCPNCGAKNNKDAAFCKICGYNLNSSSNSPKLDKNKEKNDNICPKCNENNPDDAIFCRKCGTGTV